MSGAPADLSARVTADAARGVGWVATTALVTRVLGFVALAILARIIAPEYFGLVAIATAVLIFVDALGDVGVSAALVYLPSRVAAAVRVSLVVNCALSAAWLLAGWLSAPWLARFFDEPDATMVLRAMLWIVPLRFLGNTPDALLRRDLRFRARVRPELAGALLRAVVSVGAAVGGAGVWSLVVGHLVGQAVTTALLWRAVTWPPRARLEAGVAQTMLTYGVGITAVDVLAALTHHFDLLVVGRTLGATALGYYQIGARVPEVSLGLLAWVTAKVLFPAFSRLHAGGVDTGPLWLGALRAMASIALPVGITLAILAEPIVMLLFGEAWRPSVPVVRALALYLTVRALGTHAGDVLKGTGRTGLLAMLGVIKAAMLMPLLIALAPHGIAAVATGLAAIGAVGSLLTVAVVARLSNVRAAQIVRALAPSSVATAGLAVWLGGAVFLRWSSGAYLIPTVIAGMLLYALVLRISDPRLYERIVDGIVSVTAPAFAIVPAGSGGGKS